jgi:hypothetical protein
MVGRVLRESRATTPGQLAVEVVLAERTHHEGAAIRVGLETLAREARIGTRQARRYVEQLKNLGEITVDRPTHYGPNTYVVHPGRGAEQGTRATPETGDISDQNTGRIGQGQGTYLSRTRDIGDPQTVGEPYEPGGNRRSPAQEWSPGQRRVLDDIDAEHRDASDPGWLARTLRETAGERDQFGATLRRNRAWRNAGRRRPAAGPPSFDEELAALRATAAWQAGTLDERDLMPEYWPAYRAHRAELARLQDFDARDIDTRMDHVRPTLGEAAEVGDHGRPY